VIRRIVLASIAVTTLAVALFAVPLALAVQRRQADEDRRELIKLAALAAVRVAGNRRLPPFEPEQTVGYYRLDGRRAGGTGPDALEPVGTPALQDRVVDARVGGLLVVTVPIVDEQGVVGVVRASEPLRAGRARVAGIWRRLAALGVGVIALAGLAAWGMAQRLTRPLGRLGRTAAQIGDGDFTVTVEPTGIDEIDQVGAALTHTATRVSELLAREQAFTADASHQLRTPLAGLRLTIESELAHPRPERHTALEEALGDVERLEKTIEELLLLARDTAGDRHPLDLTELLDRLHVRWQDTFAPSARSVRISWTEGLPTVRASQAAVTHILEVLMDNARHHASGDVDITVRAHPGAVSVRVKDGGPGIANAERLFERRQPGAGGNGIGLALARRLAEAEGGRLRLAQAEPVATFELVLPTAGGRPPPAGLDAGGDEDQVGGDAGHQSAQHTPQDEVVAAEPVGGPEQLGDDVDDRPGGQGQERH